MRSVIAIHCALARAFPDFTTPAAACRAKNVRGANNAPDKRAFKRAYLFLRERTDSQKTPSESKTAPIKNAGIVIYHRPPALNP